jgi:hypothetical protein
MDFHFKALVRTPHSIIVAIDPVLENINIFIYIIHKYIILYFGKGLKMDINYKLLLDAIFDGRGLPSSGIHGISHWTRVFENGMKLAMSTGAKDQLFIEKAYSNSISGTASVWASDKWGIY